jgi:hypothetical protein
MLPLFKHRLIGLFLGCLHRIKGGRCYQVTPSFYPVHLCFEWQHGNNRVLPSKNKALPSNTYVATLNNLVTSLFYIAFLGYLVTPSKTPANNLVTPSKT